MGDTLDLVVDHSASTVTLLMLQDGLPCVRVLIDAPSASAASDVQVEIVTSGDGSWRLEATQSGGIVSVDLPTGVRNTEVRCKFRKRTQQIEVQVPLVSDAAAFAVAAAAGDVGTLASLYERGHTPSGEVPEGITALIAAARNAHLPAVNFLLSKGVETDAQENESRWEHGFEGGRTALYWAVWNCSEAVVKALIEAGASPNISDVHGETPLMVAARTGHVDVLRILLEAGADDSSTDDEGWSAMEKAKARRHGLAVETIFKFRFSKT